MYVLRAYMYVFRYVCICVYVHGDVRTFLIAWTDVDRERERERERR